VLVFGWHMDERTDPDRVRRHWAPVIGGPHSDPVSRVVDHLPLTYSLAMATSVHGIESFKELVGTHLGYSEWHLIDQAQVNLFADATGDHQWIHVDPEAAKNGPFGGPIAHGYLTLALAPVLLGEVLLVDGISMGVNYGCNKVRFPSPVMVGSKLRLGAAIAEVEDVSGGVQVVLDLTLETEGSTKPSCAAQVVYRYYA